MASEKQKMMAGAWYSCHDPELFEMQAAARRACHAHNTAAPDARGAIGAELAALFASVGAESFIEAPFHCAYGVNIHLGARVYLNAGCVLLDTAPITIGEGTLLGPGVQIYCPNHHKDRAQRRAGLERARPVSLGRDVWIGGGAILLPGVHIGDGAIVGAGSVVAHDVPEGGLVAGNPARPLPAG
ncbi:MAG: sugar O-acetyltransferase [Roseovarius sp.]